MPGNFDFEALLRQEGERYLPLFLHCLKRANPQENFSEEVWERARTWRLAIAARNLFFSGELKKTLTAFNEAKIVAIPLKGVVMEEIYPAGLRPFSDMDILIHREILPKVLEILEGMGYRPHGPLWRPGAEDFQGEVAYVKEGDVPVMVEPHWSLGPPYPYPGRLDMKGIWERARPARIAGVETLILSPEDMFLHACLHLVQHNRGGWLATACDMAELVYHYREVFDWDQFMERVWRFNLALPVRYSIDKMDELFHPPVPPNVRGRLKVFRPGRLDRWVFASLTSPADKDARDTSTFLARLMSVPGLRLKIRYVRDMLFPNRDFMEERYPDLRGKPRTFFYLFRLKDITKKGVRALKHFLNRQL